MSYYYSDDGYEYPASGGGMYGYSTMYGYSYGNGYGYGRRSKAADGPGAILVHCIF